MAVEPEPRVTPAAVNQTPTRAEVNQRVTRQDERGYLTASTADGIRAGIRHRAGIDAAGKDALASDRQRDGTVSIRDIVDVHRAAVFNDDLPLRRIRPTRLIFAISAGSRCRKRAARLDGDAACRRLSRKCWRCA